MLQSVLGGSCMGIDAKPVVKFSLEGNRICVYESTMEARIDINKPGMVLTDAAIQQTLKKEWKSLGLVFNGDGLKK